jgi:predicted dehydrogenase
MHLRVGIIGFGRIGNEHAAWLNASRNARAVAVFDPTPQRIELARELGLRAVDNVDAFYGAGDFDAVLVSSPTSMHFDEAFLALMNGYHVMVEKPMALIAHEAGQLVAASRRANRILSVFHNRRWDRDFLTVKSAIDAGLFGKLINVESRLGQWSSCVGPAAREWHPTWRNEAEFGGGGLYDWGSHFIDQIWQLMLPAKPTRVFAQLRGNVWTSDCDDFARVSIDFDNGAVALVEINTTTTRPLSRWHIDGTLGSADSPYSLKFDTHEWAKLTFSPADGSGARETTGADAGLSETQIWEAFASACQGNGVPAVRVESVLTTMKLMDAARESSSTGDAVPVTV